MNGISSRVARAPLTLKIWDAGMSYVRTKIQKGSHRLDVNTEE